MEDELILRPLPDAPTRRWLLALAGGGYRGLFTARFLEKLEGEIGRPCNEVFDLIAGTSIGSILALGLAKGISAKQLVSFFTTHGAEIFPQRWALANLRMAVQPKHTATALKKTLDAQFGDATFAGLRTRVIVPAVRLGDSSAMIFRSRNGASAESSETLVDAALASAAAPLYFAPHTIGSSQFADGGLIANAPDALVTVEASAALGWRAETLHLLSVGTTAVPTGLATSHRSFRWSILGWVWRNALLEQMMAAQAELARSLARSMLGDRAVMVDAHRGPEQDKAVGLDRATKQATDALLSLADAAWTAFRAEQQSLLDRLKRRPPTEAPVGHK